MIRKYNFLSMSLSSPRVLYHVHALWICRFVEIEPAIALKKQLVGRS